MFYIPVEEMKCPY